MTSMMAAQETFCCGLMSCFLPEDAKDQLIQSRQIDRQLARDKVDFRRTVKVLLLGSGESGKSTFLKQMRIINGRNFEEAELKQYRLVIYGNIVKGMKVLIDARDKLHINMDLQDNLRRASFVFGYDNNIKLEEPVFLQYVPAIMELWKDKGIQNAWDRRGEFQLIDSVKYFLDNLERISQPNYIPTNADILHSRKATKGISEHEFIIRKIPFRFVDVGGQRSQRQKWFQCFTGVKSILFLVSSSEFDQNIYEDHKTNRLVESCNIFEAIVNNRNFADVSIILFLNKTDLLAEKVRHVSINNWFPAFSGDPRSLADVQRFQLSLFDAKRHNRTRPLFNHFTTAVDTENIKFVFQAVKDTILQDNLNSLMLQ